LTSEDMYMASRALLNMCELSTWLYLSRQTNCRLVSSRTSQLA